MLNLSLITSDLAGTSASLTGLLESSHRGKQHKNPPPPPPQTARAKTKEKEREKTTTKQKNENQKESEQKQEKERERERGDACERKGRGPAGRDAKGRPSQQQYAAAAWPPAAASRRSRFPAAHWIPHPLDGPLLQAAAGF